MYDFLCFLLQLPSPQLEGALKKFASLRGPLAAYANQPSIKTSLPRYKLVQTINNSFCQKLLIFEVGLMRKNTLIYDIHCTVVNGDIYNCESKSIVIYSIFMGQNM